MADNMVESMADNIGWGMAENMVWSMADNMVSVWLITCMSMADNMVWCFLSRPNKGDYSSLHLLFSLQVRSHSTWNTLMISSLSRSISIPSSKAPWPPLRLGTPQLCMCGMLSPRRRCPSCRGVTLGASVHWTFPALARCCWLWAWRRSTLWLFGGGRMVRVHPLCG